jgi:hypothetical protein
MVIFRQRPVFVEVKSKARVASRAQKRVRAELMAAGASWWMARSARGPRGVAAFGVQSRLPWGPPELRPWEGPFDGLENRRPQHPAVATQRREAARRRRERQRALKAAQATTARADATAASA